MNAIEKIVKQMRDNPKDVIFDDLCNACKHYFGEPRTNGSHRIYKTPWQGDPRIYIQDDNGKAKAYQVRQELKAIEKLGG
jgi:ribosomal protein S24E